jgi:hypothetical protein
VTEIILNLAWALCSLGLIWFWTRAGVSGSRSSSRKTQLLALGIVVLLLLPVISLSDDLMAMQGPAESDTCLRRALHANESHPSVIPHSMAMPEELFTTLSIRGMSQKTVQSYRVVLPRTFLIRSLDSRPPPRA